MLAFDKKISSFQINEEGLTNIFIDFFLKHFCDNYAGCFSNDEIPRVEKNNYSLVLNLSSSKQKGSHFIVVIIKTDAILYIDSFGLICFDPLIRKFMLSFNRPILFNKRQIQHFLSKKCGFYAILYCLYFDRDRDYLITFSSDLMTNDKKCIQHIINIIDEK